MPTDARGVSAPLALALLFAVVLSGIAVVVTVGVGALDETRDQMDLDRAEKVLTQFDSKSAVVALGETDSQEVPLATAGDSGFSVREGAGWMNVTVTSGGTVSEVVNVTLGAVVYEDDSDVMAYQGGGVWKETSAGATMVSPPEFHFRAQTLTLPVVSLGGDSTLEDSVTVTRAGSTSVRFPNESDDPDFVNPVTGEQVNVTVHSDYYRAWAEYFERRTDGDATVDHENETATARLVVPFDEAYDNIIATTKGTITVRGNDDPPDPHETGVPYPLADARIEAKVEECETDPTACGDLDAVGTITSPGTYYKDQLYSGTLEVDNPGGNVTIVVDGNFQPDGVTVDMADEYATTVLVRNSFSIGGNDDLNPGGPAGNFVVALHSDGAFNGNGKYRITGLLYAPGTDCNLNGGKQSYTNVIGGVVCETVTINGNPNSFVYDSSIEDTDLRLGSDATKITYLHVTVNRVEVSDD